MDDDQLHSISNLCLTALCGRKAHYFSVGFVLSLQTATLLSATPVLYSYNTSHQNTFHELFLRPGDAQLIINRGCCPMPQHSTSVIEQPMMLCKHKVLYVTKYLAISHPDQQTRKIRHYMLDRYTGTKQAANCRQVTHMPGQPKRA